MKRPRTVFGRRRVTISGKVWRIEMRGDHIAVKRLYTRNGWDTIPLQTLVRADVRVRPHPELPL